MSARRSLILAALTLALSAVAFAACGSLSRPGPTPDLKATEDAIRAELVATMTAEAPTDTPPAATNPPPTATETATTSAAATEPSLPTETPEPTATAAPMPTDTPPPPTSTPIVVVVTATPEPTLAPPTPEPSPTAPGASESQACLKITNWTNREVTITFTRKDGTWNNSITLPPNSDGSGPSDLLCMDPGGYTYTVSGPGARDLNGEYEAKAGVYIDWPLYYQR